MRRQNTDNHRLHINKILYSRSFKIMLTMLSTTMISQIMNLLKLKRALNQNRECPIFIKRTIKGISINKITPIKNNQWIIKADTSINSTTMKNLKSNNKTIFKYKILLVKIINRSKIMMSINPFNNFMNRLITQI